MNWNPDPWNTITVDYTPRNSLRNPVGGIVAIMKDRLTEKSINEFYTDILYDEGYFNIDPDDTEFLAEMRDKILLGLIEKTQFGFRFVHPAFRAKFSTMGVSFYNPPEEPWFNYDRSRFDILSFEMADYEISLYNRYQVYWFIDFMKKVFLYLNAEYAWSDHFDYLFKHKYDDARQYVFGLTFYGKEMVEQIGRDKLLSAPVYKVEELENGGIMLQLHDHPFCKLPEKERRPILKHLGIKRPKKAKPPEWIKKRAPKRIKLEEEAKVGLIVGVNASEVKLKGIPGTLFDFYCENIHGKLRDYEEIPYAVGFVRWFDGLDTGLRAYAAGSDEGGEEGGDYEAFIGLPVLEPTDILTKEGDTFIPVHDLDIGIVPRVFHKVEERLKALSIDAMPRLYSLVHLFQGGID